MTVSVLWLFHTVPRFGLQCVSVVFSRIGVIQIVIVINCISITFSKVIACNCNSDVTVIIVFECN